MTNYDPQVTPEEKELAGREKELAERSVSFDPSNLEPEFRHPLPRICFGGTQKVQHNVKVITFRRISLNRLDLLKRYWELELSRGRGAYFSRPHDNPGRSIHDRSHHSPTSLIPETDQGVSNRLFGGENTDLDTFPLIVDKDIPSHQMQSHGAPDVLDCDPSTGEHSKMCSFLPSLGMSVYRSRMASCYTNFTGTFLELTPPLS